MENPCYNSQSKQDCPNRYPGCAVDCKAWSQYVIKREREKQLKRKKIHEQRDVEAVNIHGVRQYKKQKSKRR